MKILVSSINFYPDHAGIALYATDLPVYFAEQGHEVTMVTGFSYYPKWTKQTEDRWRFFRTEIFQNVETLRGYLYVPQNVNTFSRILHELSFLFFAFINFWRAGRQDCIVIISPPLLLGLIGIFFKKIWKAKLVFHVQDLQPDAALSLGMIKENVIIRLLRKAERFIYRHSDLVVTITDGMYEKMLDKEVPKEKLIICYNWIDLKQASLLRQSGNFLNQFPEVRGKFTIAYAGNIGIKQGVDILVQLAEATSQNKALHYFIIGEGADRQRLLNLAAQKYLHNLTFLPFLNPEQYFDMLQDIDVLFVAQKSGTGNIFFPSKLLGIMAQSKPLLISADLDSELANVVRKAGCGLVAPAGDIERLCEHIDFMYKNPDALCRMGKNGYSWVKRYDREVVLSSFLHEIVSLS